MRSLRQRSISQSQVQAYAQDWLTQKLSLKDAGWKCTAVTVWRVLLIAAARMSSIYAACRCLSGGPSDDALGKALQRWLPERSLTLEEWFQPVLASQWLPRALFRKGRTVAIDGHYIPYHGQPARHENEICRGQSKSGTTRFHGYATACVVHKGFRYTLAVTQIKKGEPLVAVQARLLDRLKQLGLPIKRLLLDRQFCTSPVMADLQSRGVPYLMPLKFCGRKPRSRRPKAAAPKRPLTMRHYRQQNAGRYRFAWISARHAVTFDIVIVYKTFVHARTQKRVRRKLYFAAWRVHGSGVELRELYRTRFAIESSYRQLGQARIRTSTREPVQRLLFVLIGLVLRNLWVWLHWTYLSEGPAEKRSIQLQRLRFRQMLQWIELALILLLHDGTEYRTEVQPRK